MSRQIFLNLAVRDLPASKAFFARLGFAFNPQFTDDKAACMILSEQGFVMLLAEPFFRTFTTLEPCDTATHTEAFIAISCASRAEVDQLVRALASLG